MIFLFTDFGLKDWYLGQMHAVLVRLAPSVPVIDLMHGVAPFDVRAGAYLLRALAAQLPEGSITVGVVDPGVGGSRRPMMMEADRRWFVGPDNGLFSLIWRQTETRRAYTIDWRPETLSASFHGRDLFAPVAAMLARGRWPDATEMSDPMIPEGWEEDCWQVIHVDRYGNAVTGIRGASLEESAILAAGGRHFRYGATFCAAATALPFWYRNSVGLVELAIPEGNLSDQLGLEPGHPVELVK